MNILNRIDIADESSCCGCLSCADSCPTGAISMVENAKGFIMPSIDEGKCINCGLCLKKCDFKDTQRPSSNNTIKAYSLVVNDKTVLKQSTSGGAFTALSDVFLNNSGYVVGAIVDESFSVHHVVASNKLERDRMRGSKYVQSNTYGVFKSVKGLLSEGKDVLFTGSPCQCAALKSFLDKDYEKLTVVDFLCHGVPNNRMFKEHIEYLGKYYRKPSEAFTFRDKAYGWDSYINTYIMANGRKGVRWINQIYYSFFVKNLSLRPACHHCPYRSLHRPSDITIADFWGIEKLTGKKDRDGVSLVLTHSEKGITLLESIKANCTITEYPFEKIANRISLSPSKPGTNSAAFWDTYLTNGYKGIANRFFSNSRKDRIKFEVRKLAKKLRLG